MAKKHLLRKGYRIIAQNYFIKFDEIDIVALESDKTLVFLEVKTLRYRGEALDALIPEDNLTSQKYRKMIRAAEIFIAKHPQYIDEERGWRMDLIAILLDDDGILFDLRHYENI